MYQLVSKLGSCLTSGEFGLKTSHNLFKNPYILSFVTKYEDTKVVCGCKVATAFLMAPLLYDYFWVN